MGVAVGEAEGPETTCPEFTEGVEGVEGVFFSIKFFSLLMSSALAARSPPAPRGRAGLD